MLTAAGEWKASAYAIAARHGNRLSGRCGSRCGADQDAGVHRSRVPLGIAHAWVPLLKGTQSDIAWSEKALKPAALADFRPPILPRVFRVRFWGSELAAFWHALIGTGSFVPKTLE
jgi:hypothetical protein